MEDKEVYWTVQAKLGHKQAGYNPHGADSQGVLAGEQWKSGLLEPAHWQSGVIPGDHSVCVWRAMEGLTEPGPGL